PAVLGEPRAPAARGPLPEAGGLTRRGPGRLRGARRTRAPRSAAARGGSEGRSTLNVRVTPFLLLGQRHARDRAVCLALVVGAGRERQAVPEHVVQAMALAEELPPPLLQDVGEDVA